MHREVGICISAIIMQDGLRAKGWSWLQVAEVDVLRAITHVDHLTSDVYLCKVALLVLHGVTTVLYPGCAVDDLIQVLVLSMS